MADVALAIDTEHLTKFYGESRGIVDVDLDVEAGDVFGFLGPNGAGKTTTIRVLLDLIRPTSGTATVLGLDARRDSVAIRRRVGYLPGEYALYPKLTGAETLRYYGNLRGGVDWSYVETLAQRLDFDMGRRAGDLSTGNKRKLGLIQALMHRPELVILDEPTSGLDPLVQREFYALVDEARAAGQTIFLSSHVLPEVQRVCSRVGFVREGRLVAVEDVAALGTKAVHHVEIEFAGPAPKDDFAALPGVGALTSTDHRLAFTVQGTLDAVVKTAARHEVVALTSREPDLEDLFLAYYGEARAGVAPATAMARRPAMLRDAFFKGLRDQRRSLLIWVASVVGYVVMMCSLFPSIRESLSRHAGLHREHAGGVPRGLHGRVHGLRQRGDVPQRRAVLVHDAALRDDLRHRARRVADRRRGGERHAQPAARLPRLADATAGAEVRRAGHGDAAPCAPRTSRRWRSPMWPSGSTCRRGT